VNALNHSVFPTFSQQECRSSRIKELTSYLEKVQNGAVLPTT
jgi:hypothetical protein